ncbi:hypothetical protein L596_010945 [Steinernema carpocapsae]|uniref:AAA+ ATPase domain-containing protein n=1 Tax=Steinernema carpocapsae TaxID=34508 RepID=A0A4U5PKZ7_STECR|nr:hypothetical protein L596_010945 [Steinernema carpocapsae]
MRLEGVKYNDRPERGKTRSIKKIADLRKFAKQHIDIGRSWTKADIIDALDKKKEEILRLERKTEHSVTVSETSDSTSLTSPNRKGSSESMKSSEESFDQEITDEILIDGISDAVDKQLALRISSDTAVSKKKITSDSIIGCTEAKTEFNSAILMPLKYPYVFSGARAPTKGFLLYGPPGTGKTRIVKAIASEFKCRFFAISPSTITSKHYGESERLIKVTFSLAKAAKTSITFFDEIDAIGQSRSDCESEPSKRLLMELMLQLNDVIEDEGSSVFVLAATNRPHVIDSALFRRFAKRIFVDLPTERERLDGIKSLFRSYNEKCELRKSDME